MAMLLMIGSKRPRLELHHAKKDFWATPTKAEVARKRTTSLLFLHVVDEPWLVSVVSARESSD
jgi:hypothetical protein